MPWSDPVPTDVDALGALTRVACLLDHVAFEHARGRAWSGFGLDPLDALRPGPPPESLVERLPAPAALGRAGIRADLHALRRLLIYIGAALRFATEDRPVAHAIAEGLTLGRGAFDARAARARILDETEQRLRTLRRDLVRRVEASGTVDIRLDAWPHVGDAHDMRRFLGEILHQRAEYARFGRQRLGRLIDERRALDDALVRVAALRLGGAAPTARPATGPLVLTGRPAPDDRPAPLCGGISSLG